MALIIIRLHPVEPVNGGDFEAFLRDLVIEAFDIGINNGPDGVSVGSASYVPPPIPPTPWIPASTTRIVQHFEVVSPTLPPQPLAAATAAIRVATPAGYTEHNESDLRFKVTRGGKEILSSQLYYNVPVSTSALPKDRGTLPGLSPTSLYLALPDRGREIDPADAFVPVSPDGTPPRYDILLNAVTIVLTHDPGSPAQLADLTPTQARHVAYEIVWNQKYRPLPAPKKRTLEQMFTLPDSGLAARLSQRALSAASGVSLRWLVTLEQGQGRPSDDVCRKLAAGFLPDGSELARAVLDLRLRRAAGESLVMWNRRRPPRVATRRLYAEAGAVLDAEDAKREAEQQASVAVFLEEFRAQWGADAASAPSPSNPAEAWPGGWPRVRG